MVFYKENNENYSFNLFTNLTGYYWGILEFGIRSARHKDPNRISVNSVILLAKNEKNKFSKPFKIQT